MEDRIRALELWQARQDSVSSERYESIRHTVAEVRKDVTELRIIVQKRMDWLLIVVIILALANVFGGEQLAAIIARFFR